MPDQKKRTKKVIEIPDLKPKKDARGGVSADVNANVNANRFTAGRSPNRHSVDRQI
jgi:hypothetical protein